MELEIFKLLQKGKSIRQTASLLDVGVKKVRIVKEQGRFYLDLDTRDIVFTSKSIPTEEQIFHYIMNETQADFTSIVKFIDSKHSATVRRWRNKEIKLVGCDECGNIDENILKTKEEFIATYGNVEQTQRKRKRGKRIRGLYLLYQNDELHYIGMSNNVNFRLYQHSYSSHLVELQGEYDVKIIEVENYSDLRLLEEILIRLLKPKLNKEYVDDNEMGELFKQYLDMISSGYSRKLYVK